MRPTLENDRIAALLATSDWKTAILEQWTFLGLRILRLDLEAPLSPREVALECSVLVCLAAWIKCKGNITHAAVLLNTSRRALRGYIKIWKNSNPNPLLSRCTHP
jgi:hypothetical protein